LLYGRISALYHLIFIENPLMHMEKRTREENDRKRGGKSGSAGFPSNLERRWREWFKREKIFVVDILREI
jgi:hypothetical protein